VTLTAQELRPEMHTAELSASTERRVSVIWALLFFNGLAYTAAPTVIHIPSPVAKAMTQGALCLAFLLVLTVNRGRLVRPSVILALFTVLAALALVSSSRAEVGSGLGSMIRSVRFLGFMAVLWLLTPWWARRDLLLVRIHLRCLIAVCGLVLLGLMISPSKATSFQGRLTGTIWPIPAPQVAHYSAVLVGVVTVLWMSGAIRRRYAAVIIFGGLAMLILTHTRTALLGLVVGVVLSALSLFATHRKVRRGVAFALVAVTLVAVLFAPAISSWLTRGQSSQQLHSLTGRAAVWSALVHAPRSDLDRLIGAGLSNKSFNGLPIDNSWLATYQDQGLAGDVIVGAVLLMLLLMAAFRPPGRERAIAIFLIMYCVVASYTETGLGDVSPYLLDLTVAASLLAVPVAARTVEVLRS
jgi:hypothetical protein